MLRVALMLYGTMNTHKFIYDNSSFMPIGRILNALRNSGQIDYRAFIYTEDKAFFKWTPQEFFVGNKVHDYPILEWVEDRYCVAQCDENELLQDFERIYGECLGKVIILKDAFDRNKWNSSSDDYRKPNTSNRWRNTMITTFFEKKKKVFTLCQDYQREKGMNFDVFILARPDSSFYLKTHVDASERNNLKLLESSLLNDIEKLVGAEKNTIYVDKALYDNSFSQKQGFNKGLIKNDLIFAKEHTMQIHVGFYDKIIEETRGNYFSLYPEVAYRCSNCFHIEPNQKTKTCRQCKKPDTLQNISEWPEYKMFEHLQRYSLSIHNSLISGKVIR
jgi:hypothetical protein